MKDLRNIREEWGIAEKIALHVREFHPEVYERALNAIVKEESQPTLHWDSLPTPNELNKMKKK